MSDQPHIPSGLLQALLRYLDQRGLALPVLRAELEAQLTHSTISARAFCDWLDTIAQADPVPALGLRIGKAAQPEHLGVVGYLVTACNDLQQALSRYRRFQKLIQSSLVSKVDETNSTLTLQWSLGNADTPLAYEFSAALFVNLYQTLTGSITPPIRLEFPFAPPQDTGVYPMIMGCPVGFNAQHMQVVIPIQLMTMRIASRDPYLYQLLEQQAVNLLQQPRQAKQQSFTAQVEDQIIQGMKDGDTRADTIARRLGYSTRTFYRLLSDAGQSYRLLLADTRRRLAKHYLADTRLSLSEIALLLGYSEQSAFMRAFKQWLGMTPGDYRQKQHNR